MLKIGRMLMAAAIWWNITVPALASPHDVGDANRWIVVASRADLGEARAFAQQMQQKFTSTTLFRAENGYFAVSIGTAGRSEAEALRDRLVRRGSIPGDSFLSRGQRFVERVPIAVSSAKPAAPRQSPQSSGDTTGSGSSTGALVAVGLGALILLLMASGDSGSSGSGSSRTPDAPDRRPDPIPPTPAPQATPEGPDGCFWGYKSLGTCH